MGLIYAEIELINAGDLELVRRGNMDKDEIRRTWATTLVDSGSYLLAINENIQEVLQLSVISKDRFELASGEIQELDVVGPVEVRFKNRSTSCRALVLPGSAEPLLGSITLEGLDVLIDPARQRLIPHPAHEVATFRL